MIFNVKTKEIYLTNGEFDGYDTVEFDVDDDEIEIYMYELCLEEFGKDVLKFVKTFNLEPLLLSYYYEDLEKYAQNKHYEVNNNGNRC